jgi:DNA-binding XRE family transcriptional regulator
MTKPPSRNQRVTPADWPTALRDLRRRRGWSQPELARAIGAHPNSVWRCEAGRSIPTGACRSALERLLGDDCAPLPAEPLVTADGFASHAIAGDAATGCNVWQGACNGDGAPIAQPAGQRRQLRRLVWERSGRSLDRSTRLTTTCGNPRCLSLAHLTSYAAAPKPAPRPKRLHPLRPLLAEALPPTKPDLLTDREWTVLTGIRDGRSLAEIGADIRLTRQRVNDVAKIAYARLTNLTESL